MSARGLVTVFGGSGFVGRYVVRELAARGWRVRVACRHPETAGHLQPLGGVGQIHLVAANICDTRVVRQVIEGADAIVNLVGILASGGRQTFREVHIEGARRIAEAAKTHEICNFVHVSAIGADSWSKARYARSKACAEQKVLQACPKAVILRPSIIFGEEDEFFNRFAAMATVSPFLPSIGSGKTKFQPVYVGDVARAVAAALEGRVAHGEIYELGGPGVYSFRQLLHMTQRYSGRAERLFPLPFFLATLQGAVLQYLPGRLLTVDQVRMLKTNNVVSAKAVREGRTLEAFGIAPRAVEDVVPVYLEKYRPRGMFSHYQS